MNGRDEYCMENLSTIYRPITAQPFKNNESYIEIQPCEALKPYIRCFWGTPEPLEDIATLGLKHELIIPDTCMDIIFNINMDTNEIWDIFNGINDTSFSTKLKSTSNRNSCFAIRFNFWAVSLFCHNSLDKVLNAVTETEVYFSNFTRDLQDILINNPLITDRVEKTECYLLKKFNLDRQNNNVMNAVYKLLKSRGTVNISELAQFTSISQRHLERLFLQYIGVTPKKLSGLIRYQYLWRDILVNRNINIQDAVFKYGYTDQSHLNNDFKKYHAMTPRDAMIYAYKIR